MREVRKKYWNPRDWDEGFINEERFLYPFNMTLAEGEWTSWHDHPCWGELTVVTSGSVVIETKDFNYLVDPARCLWIPPRLEHDFYTLKSGVNRTIFVHESMFAGNERFSSCMIIEGSPLLYEMIKVVDDWKLDFSVERDRRIGLVLWNVIERSEVHPRGLPLPRNRRLQKIANEFLNDVDSRPSLDSWAEDAGVSTRTLSRLFFSETGMTIGRWMQQAKMEYAYGRLKEGDSVTDVAFACGYNSVSSFILAFRKQFGVTPGAVARPS